jgi:hypothetical protein
MEVFGLWAGERGFYGEGLWGIGWVGMKGGI